MKEVSIPQYNKRDVLSRAINLVTHFEGFSKKCKWDNKQYSWGYGTKCTSPGAIIGEEMAKKLKIKHLEGNYNRIKHLNKNLSDDEMVGLISFYYNTGNFNETTQYVEKGDILSTKYIMNKYIMKGSKYEKGLTDRRIKEIAVMEGVGIF